MEYFPFDKEKHHKTTSGTSTDHHNHHHPTPSNSELLASAKTIANAAKAKFQNDQNYKFDKDEVAGAAENLLHAASHYGKLDEKGNLGKVVGKAETYLHQHHSSHSTTTGAAAATETTAHTKPGKDHGSHSGGGYGDYIKMAEGLLNNKHSGGGDHHEGQSGGEKYGEYIKMAEGMLKKHSAGEGGHNSGSGYGDYIKMAGEFLKK